MVGAALGAAMLALAPAARAADLVPSDQATSVDLLPSVTAPDTPAGSSGEMSIEFTPRNPLLLLLGETPEPSSEPASLQLSLGSSSSIADRLGVIEGGVGEEGADPALGLEVGGALHWSDWSVGSSYARTRLFGGDADLISASLGYGRMTARLAYGESSRPQSAPVDVLMFSTDLAAWSWLSLEGDLALGSSPSREDDSMAAGRLGIRLRF